MNTPELAISTRKSGTFLRYLRQSLIGISLLGLGVLCALAQDGRQHLPSQQQVKQQAKADTGPLIKIVRESTERFKDVHVAQNEGYALMFGCVTGQDYGAMDLHYIDGKILSRSELDPTRPQIVIYES